MRSLTVTSFEDNHLINLNNGSLNEIKGSQSVAIPLSENPWMPKLNTGSETSPVYKQPIQFYQEVSKVEEERKEREHQRDIEKFKVKQLNRGRNIATVIFFLIVIIYWATFRCDCNRDLWMTIILISPIAFFYFNYDLIKPFIRKKVD